MNGKQETVTDKEPEKLVNPKLVIELQGDGQLLVTGVIKNEMLALWMLEKAKDTIKSFNTPKVVSNGDHMFLNFLKHKR